MHDEGDRSVPQAEGPVPSLLPVSPVQSLVDPFVRFMQIEAASGLVLLGCTAAALMLSNSRFAEAIAEFWKTPIGFFAGGFRLEETLGHWVNDGLMTIFFFVVGLEIKHELVAGELRDPKKAALPAFAALGGMIVPAAIFLSFQWRQAGEHGWGIAMATDIAFVVGFLSLLGSRVPPGLKVFLLTLAILDDIGAVLVIAFFYTEKISWLALGLAFIGFGLTYVFNRIGVRQLAIYVVTGTVIWLAFLKSGIHPTVAGVLLGLLTPASAWVGEGALLDVLKNAFQHLGGRSTDAPRHRPEVVGQLATAAVESVSPLRRLESMLQPWVAFGIMPLFALANAGVSLEAGAFADPVAVAVAIGLVVGKPLGIMLFSWFAVRSGAGLLPEGVDWKVLLGAACLAGIGFTMSLFIAGLAFDGELLDAAKVGTLVGSSVSAVAGFVMLFWFLRQNKQSNEAEGQRFNG